MNKDTSRVALIAMTVAELPQTQKVKQVCHQRQQSWELLRLMRR